MPVVSEMVHPSGLDFSNQCKVVFRRRQYKEAWAKIAQKVFNRKGEHPSKELVRRVYKKFTAKKGRAKYNYDKCGRKPWKVSKSVEGFLFRRLRALRRLPRRQACARRELAMGEPRHQQRLRLPRKHLQRDGRARGGQRLPDRRSQQPHAALAA